MILVLVCIQRYNMMGGINMAKTKTSTAVKRRYNEKAYDRLAITIPKGKKATVEAYAQNKGLSVNGLINALLREALNVSEDAWKALTEE